MSFFTCISFVFQLLMGVFYYVNAVALSEDIPIDEHKFEEALQQDDGGKAYIDSLYSQSSKNCFIAAALYVTVTIFSFIQYKLNARANYSIS